METSDVEFEEVLKADGQRFRAMVSKDVDVLETLLADELLYTHSSGVTDSKQHYLETIRSAYVVYHSADIDELVFKRRGHIAMLMGQAKIEATIGGVDRLLSNRFFASWLKDDGQWRLLAWVSIPPPQ